MKITKKQLGQVKRAYDLLEQSDKMFNQAEALSRKWEGIEGARALAADKRVEALMDSSDRKEEQADRVLRKVVREMLHL